MNENAKRKYTIAPTTQFRKDCKKAQKQSRKKELLQKVVDQIAQGKPLPEKHRDHELSGIWTGYRECHIAPDWMLIYRLDTEVLAMTLARTGSHSDIFQ